MTRARTPKRVLINGLGVAGPTLAWWLAASGFDVTVVERAPAARPGGYMIDFWGLGYDVAERMGILEDLKKVGYLIDEIRLVGADSRRVSTIGAKAVRETMGERFFSLMRGDLAQHLYHRVADRASIRFDDAISGLRQRDNGVEVMFHHAPDAIFDIVVGADGLHSQVRRAIAPEPCERPLGFWAASFAADRYPHRDPGAYVCFTRVGRQVARYALRDGRTAFLLVCRSPDGATEPPATLAAQKAFLRAVYGADGWECPEMLARLDASEELYFDQVAQVRAPRWSSGRLVLVGDAACCPSLLAGEGASFAMAGAYVLAHELDRCGEDFSAAFDRYEQRLRPSIERKQKGALWLGGWFAPRTALGLHVRNALSRLAATPIFARALVGDMLRQDIALS